MKSSYEVDRDRLGAWLAAYGDAWERKDARAFTALFSPDVRYHWTPFDAPKEGREGLAAAFEAAVARQEHIGFEAEVLCANARTGIAHWHCSFGRSETGRRVHLDGIFLVEFDGDGLGRVFREWWHSDEPS